MLSFVTSGADNTILTTAVHTTYYPGNGEYSRKMVHGCQIPLSFIRQPGLDFLHLT